MAVYVTWDGYGNITNVERLPENQEETMIFYEVWIIDLEKKESVWMSEVIARNDEAAKLQAVAEATRNGALAVKGEDEDEEIDMDRYFVHAHLLCGLPKRG